METEPPANGESSGDPPLATAASTPRWRWLLDPLVLGCAIGLVAFPFVATLAADRQPIAPASSLAALPTPATAGPSVRDLPLFSPGGAAAKAVADGRILTDSRALRAALGQAMDALVGRTKRAALERLLLDDRAAFDYGEPPYPFHFEAIDAVLDAALPRRLTARQVRAANDLGGLLVLAASRPATGQSYEEWLPSAAPVAFALLDRGRAGGDCLPQLNLAFLLSTHERPRAGAVATEFRKAEQSCPNDPTPLWLLGEFQSQLALIDPVAHPASLRRLDPAFATFHRLEERFPGSSAGWAGEADAELRAGYQLDVAQRFSARARFRHALELYRHARTLDADPGLAAGEARANAALALHGEAARLQREVIAEAARAAPLQALLVEYLERDGRFAQAAREAARLERSHPFPVGPGLFMELDGDEPLSLGSERLVPVTLDLAPIFPTPAARTALLDLSFIPTFRSVDGLTGYDRSCPGWSHRRDLVLAGRAEQALAGMPRRFVNVHPAAGGEECSEASAPLLAAVAELETGNRKAALKRLTAAEYDTEGRRPAVFLEDARQNLWRFAGRLDDAGAATKEWIEAMPTSVLAFDQAGEVAFLAKDYDRAARLFGTAARLARSAAGSWSLDEASALVKRGTALELAGRYDEALPELAEADEVASRVYGAARRNDDDETEAAAYVSYNARLQAADTQLRSSRYSAAQEQYEAARERERDLGQIAPGEPARRPEVLDNNQALVEIELGDAEGGLEAVRRAIRADPLNPIFLQNLGLALQHVERPEEAVAAYQAAVASDPSNFPAWNDLGVVLAEQRRLEDAAAAFRRSVGVRPEYALGWFNLGVALERTGLRHAFASQGAFGRAFRADPELRGSERDFVADDGLYFTTLDLSKPLPPKWEFARAQERTPVAVAGIALALLFGLQFGRSALSPGMGREAKRWLELGRDALARLPAAFSTTTAGVACAATLAVFLLPLLRSGERSLTSVLLLVLGVGALIAIVMRSRVLAARRAGVTLRQRGWSPGIAVALVAAALGLGWAPLPVAETDRAASAVHWIGPVATGIAALVLLALGVGLEVPATQAIGTAALVMTASLLTPIEPLDGSFVAKGPAGLAFSVSVLAVAVFFLLGLG